MRYWFFMSEPSSPPPPSQRPDAPWQTFTSTRARNSCARARRRRRPAPPPPPPAPAAGDPLPSRARSAIFEASTHASHLHRLRRLSSRRSSPRTDADDRGHRLATTARSPYQPPPGCVQRCMIGGASRRGHVPRGTSNCDSCRPRLQRASPQHLCLLGGGGGGGNRRRLSRSSAADPHLGPHLRRARASRPYRATSPSTRVRHHCTSDGRVYREDLVASVSAGAWRARRQAAATPIRASTRRRAASSTCTTTAAAGATPSRRVRGASKWASPPTDL